MSTLPVREEDLDQHPGIPIERESASRHTANGLGSAEDLLDGAAEFFCERLVSHGAGNFDDIVDADVAGVHSALLLLAVSGGLLEGADDEGGSGGNDGDGSLTVLDGELHSHTETLPVASGLGDVFTDFFRGLNTVHKWRTSAICMNGELRCWRRKKNIQDREDRS